MRWTAAPVVFLLAFPVSVALASPPLGPDAGVSRAADGSTRDAAAFVALRHEPEEEPAAQRLNRLLAEAQRNTALSRAPDPVLDHHPDGTYSFVGNGIKATIEPDGRVHFHDSYISGLHFDLNAWMEHLAHNDPYRSERHWFLERTEPLREQLASARTAAAARVTGKALERALGNVWTNPAFSCERRKQETMRFWDAASFSSQPEAQRAAIESFVRQRGTRDRSCLWTAEDLQRGLENAQLRTAPKPDAGASWQEPTLRQPDAGWK